MPEEMESLRVAQKSYAPLYHAAIDARDFEQARAIRNELIAQRKYAIDVNYSQYEAALTAEGQGVGFLSSTTVQGLTTAGALFTPASTTRILSGIAGAVSATRGHYNDEILLEQTMRTIQKQMRASRSRIAAHITARMTQNIADYPLSSALSDLEDYYRAGTLTTGVIDTSTTVGIEEQQAKREELVSGTIRAEDRANFILRGTAGAALAPRGVVQRLVRPDSPHNPFYERIIGGYDPKRHSESYVQRVLRRLCASEAELTKPAEKVEARILAYQQYRRDFEGDKAAQVTGKLSARDMDLLANIPPCRSDRFRNVYEATAFPKGINDPGLIDLMNKRLTALGRPTLAPGATVAQVRARISELRNALNSNLLAHPGLADQLTADLVNTL